MELEIQIKMNHSLFLRDPESSELGKNIIRNSIEMIYELGFEDFTFKKLANRIGTTEASIYRYFENKHRLLTYIITWFWTWLEYQLVFHTNNIKDPASKVIFIIKLLTFQAEDKFLMAHIDKNILYRIMITEGNKAYLTKHVEKDNQARIFKPYKDFSSRIADIFTAYNPKYQYPHSLASTLIETAYHQIYFKDYLPSLTDFGKTKDLGPLENFLNDLVFSALKKGAKS
jgi:AcrR family transcriptional regulator